MFNQGGGATKKQKTGIQTVSASSSDTPASASDSDSDDKEFKDDDDDPKIRLQNEISIQIKAMPIPHTSDSLVHSTYWDNVTEDVMEDHVLITGLDLDKVKTAALDGVELMKTEMEQINKEVEVMKTVMEQVKKNRMEETNEALAGRE